ncbi:MAG: hypothetical protein IJ035_04210 [Oscillospiraceae bacterium]|nr:hypothetical protein [Oscillospiraceae bacterium]
MKIRKALCTIAVCILMLGVCSCKPNNNNETESITMINSFNEKANFVDKLVQEYNPPQNPKWVVDNDVKAAVESRLGAELPKDYYDYINAFGYGSFSYYVKVFNFFRTDGVDEYFQEIEDNNEAMNDLKKLRAMYGMNDSAAYVENGEVISVDKGNANKGSLSDYDELSNISLDVFDKNTRLKIKKYGVGYPYEFYNDGVGLIYWGRTDDVNFFWNYYENGYTVIAYMENNVFYEFDMSFSEFLYIFLNGEMGGIANPNNVYTYEEYGE